MCTVSWRVQRGGYDLFFNRDELNTRAPEIPPAVDRREGVAFIAPRDGDHGGTWLLANHHGLTVCVLNDYGATWRPPASEPRFSRGQVVLACAAADDPASAAELIRRLPLARTPAFHWVALAPDEEPWVLQWDGNNLSRFSRARSVPPLTSSSYETADVIAMRTWRFGTMVRSPLVPEVGELAAYHRQHERGCGAHSVLMRRPDASTRSLTQVSVRADRISLGYEPVGWALEGPVRLAPVHLTLARRQRAIVAA